MVVSNVQNSFIGLIISFFVKGIITVWLTSCLTGLDFTKQGKLFLNKHKRSIQIQARKTGGQPCSDTFPCEVSEYYLLMIKAH